MNPQPPADTCTMPASVMLLSLWGPPAAPWHARLVGADARVHEFDSPFELARFVAQPACASPVAADVSARGLR